MLLVDDLAAGGTKNLRHTPRGLVTLLNLLSNYELTIHIHRGIIKLTGKHSKDFNMCFFNLSQGVDMTMKFD